MEPSEMVAIKKQRNAKIQRDNRKNKHNRSSKTDSADSPNPESLTTATPQPQRVNCRQRDESSNSPIIPEVTKKSSSEEVKETIMIDHSSLKRETEEIVKLTKKFSKREVSSNWHRYDTEVSNPSTQHVEEDAPADFTDLLQVPVSKGGHLQLKEEQEWASVVPKGHWALDLNQLSFSVACIPTHKRLRLPEQKLSEEEIERYILLAEEAKKYYSEYEGGDNLKNDVSSEDKPFNILDVERSTRTLISMDISLNEPPSSSIDILKQSNTNISNEIKLNVKQDIIIKHEEVLSKSNNSLNDKEFDINNSNSSNIILSEKYNKPSFEETLKNDNVSNYQQQLDNNHLGKHELNDVKLTNPLQVEKTDLEKGNNFKTIEKCHTDTINNYEIKEKRERRRINNRSSSSKEETDFKPVDKVIDSIKEIKLEDEDDLDFLLSLKKPISSENKNESKTRDLKDSSFLPGTTVASSTTTPQQADLDDWLDSVLED